MKQLTWTLAAIAIAVSLCLLLPAPIASLMTVTVAVPELAAWLLLLNLFCLWIALQFRQPTAWIFVVTAFVAAWPVIIAVRTARAFDALIGQGRSFPVLQMYQPLLFPAIPAQQLPMNILYYPPRGEGTRPVLVDIYGGAWQHGSPAVDAPFHRLMAGLGYAVFAIDYRHAPAVHFPAPLDDVRAAVEFVQTHAGEYRGDPARVVICGRSAGAQLGLLAAYAPRAGSGLPPVAAAVSFYGPTNLARGYAEVPWPDPLDVRKILETYIGGPLSAFPGAYRAASPVTYATRPLPPTLLIQGSRDHVVKAEFPRELYERLKSTGTRAYLLELPWSEHSFDAVPSGLGAQVSIHALQQFLATTAAAPLSSDSNRGGTDARTTAPPRPAAPSR